MQPEAYHRLAAREATYWWYRARRVLAARLLQRFAPPGAPVIDIGCGCGGNLALFDTLAPSLRVGLDLSPIALGYARTAAPTAALLRADLSRDLPLAAESFAVATVFNVLYHGWVHDDRALLQRIASLLRPGGILLLTEPAFGMLRRGLDRAVMGQRRYTDAGLRRLADEAGFDVLLSSYFSLLAFPFALLGALLDHMRARDTYPPDEFAAMDFAPLTARLNALLFRLACGEARLITAGWRMPFGVGLVVVLRRRGGAS